MVCGCATICSSAYSRVVSRYERWRNPAPVFFAVFLTYSGKNLYTLRPYYWSFKMKIVIEDIPDEGLEVNISEKVSLEEVSLMSPVVGRLDLLKTGGEIIITGQLQTEMELQCSRCLREFSRDLDIPVNVVYHPIKELGMERHELNDDEMDMGFYEGGELDLLDLNKEQILLNIQMKPLCDEDCKGICPECGTDLNSGSCSCKREEVDPRLEVLKKYFEKRKE
jgi:uncharacterized protein